jgi:hypothetical protein
VEECRWLELRSLVLSASEHERISMLPKSIPLYEAINDTSLLLTSFLSVCYCGVVILDQEQIDRCAFKRG